MNKHLILLPGLICDEDIWEYPAKHLKQDATIDVKSFSEGGSMDDFTSEVIKDAPERFALAGFSMGGFIALEVLRKYPERVEKIALLDTYAETDTPAKAQWRKDKIAECEQGGYDAVISSMIPILLHPTHQTGHLLGRVIAMTKRVGAETYIRRQKAIAERHETVNALLSSNIPVRIICGREDGMTSSAAQIALAGRVPGARCSVIEDCGHMSPYEQPQAVVALLRDWLIYD